MPVAISPDNTYLNVLLCSTYLVDSLDALKTTPYYRQTLRFTGNQFAKELERVINEDIPLVWGIEDETMYRCIDYQKNVIEDISKLKPEECGIVGAFIELLQSDPERAKAFLEIKYVDQVLRAPESIAV